MLVLREHEIWEMPSLTIYPFINVASCFATVDSLYHHYQYVMNIKICRRNKQLLIYYDRFNIFGGFAVIQISLICFVTSSVRPSFNGATIGINSNILLIVFRKFVEKIQVSLNSDKNSNTVHEGLFTFVIIST